MTMMRLRDIPRNARAFWGGLMGSLLLGGGAAALLAFGPELTAGVDEELALEFMPGELIRLGPALDPNAVPKIVAPESHAPRSTEVREVEPGTEGREAPAERRARPRNADEAGADDRDREGNTPFDDPRTVEELPGDPFGSPGGWSDSLAAGDPWATEVMRVLNGMQVGVFAAEGGDALFKFRVEVCPDGRLSAQSKQSTGDPTLDSRLKQAIGGLEVEVPGAVLDRLGGRCRKIRHEFTWRGRGGGSGTVQ